MGITLPQVENTTQIAKSSDQAIYRNQAIFFYLRGVNVWYIRYPSPMWDAFPNVNFIKFSILLCSTSRPGPHLPTRISYGTRLSLLGLMAKIKCSICSYQFNIWYAGHSPAHILIWFLAFGQGSEVYLTLTTGCLGIALQPSVAHYNLRRKLVLHNPITIHWCMTSLHCFVMVASVRNRPLLRYCIQCI